MTQTNVEKSTAQPSTATQTKVEPQTPVRVTSTVAAAMNRVASDAQSQSGDYVDDVRADKGGE